MPQLFPPTIEDEITCVKREITLRASNYPRWVSAGRMSAATAERELETMRAVLATLEAVQKELKHG
jgi:hypothetical protein